MDENDWDEKCSKCGESLWLTYMEGLDGMVYQFGELKCACMRYDEQEEVLRV